MKNARVYPTKGHPVVYSEWLEAGKDKPTVLIYGHYDVQPVDPIELWTSPPFEAEVRGDNLYARGSADDKGQVFIHLKAIEAHLSQNKKLPVNIKLLIEGEEEIGSMNLGTFIKRKIQSFLKCDVICCIRYSNVFQRAACSRVCPARFMLYADRFNRTEPRPALRAIRRLC